MSLPQSAVVISMFSDYFKVAIKPETVESQNCSSSSFFFFLQPAKRHNAICFAFKIATKSQEIVNLSFVLSVTAT